MSLWAITQEADLLERLLEEEKARLINSSAPALTEPIPPESLSVKPYHVLPERPFKLFRVHELNKSTDFKRVGNRHVAYYGEHQYSYTGQNHDPIPLENNSYLMKVLNYVDIVMPDFCFNSAMVTRYDNGGSGIPFHSDNEEVIEEGSDIVTISFGQARQMAFEHCRSQNIEYQLVEHGDVLIMSKLSQKSFRHAIPQDLSSNGMRISVTLRLINPKTFPAQHVRSISVSPVSSASDFSPRDVGYTSSPIVHEGYQRENQHRNQPRAPLHTPKMPAANPKLPLKSIKRTVQNQGAKVKSVLISSSMFRKLETNKLDTSSCTSKKFFYPGADAARMLNRLKADQEFQDLEHNSISKVFLLTGSNNIDGIDYDKHGCSLKGSKEDISKIILFVRKSFPNAIINIINILPRRIRARNDIINNLNKHIENLTANYSRLSYLDTYNNFMFWHSGGSRREEFFNQNRKYEDDVHLNYKGVARLGGFIKFHMHTD